MTILSVRRDTARLVHVCSSQLPTHSAVPQVRTTRPFNFAKLVFTIMVTSTASSIFTVFVTLCFSNFVAYSIKPFVLEEQIIWESSSQEEVSTYRIPIIVQLPTGDLLAFAEARKYSAHDSGAKFIAMRRSTNGGASWGPNTFILNDYHVPDGLNLGAVVIDYNASTIILIHTFCVHSVCNATGEKPTGVFMISSSNWGMSWSEPVNLGDKNPALREFHFDPGPGYGIQKKYAPNKGRLVVCGHSPFESMYCLHSDDGGVTWYSNIGLIGMPYGQPKLSGDFVPGEVQIVELKNGTILANVRNTHAYHCHCRIQALSFDGGVTFSMTTMQLKQDLLDPNVDGSILNFHNDEILFFTIGYSTSSRVNLTLHWSLDSGQTYPYLMNIYEKGSAYSCLTTINENHIGVVYEKDNYEYISFVKIQLNL